MELSGGISEICYRSAVPKLFVFGLLYKLQNHGGPRVLVYVGVSVGIYLLVLEIKLRNFKEPLINEF